jgi:hypothetical protein
MTDVFIISEANLRQFTDINNNVDSELLKNAVREAQDIETQRILGTKLYEAILAKIETSTLAGDYEYLVLNFVQNALLYEAYYYALEDIYLRPRNNGLLIPTGGENSEKADGTWYNRKRQSVQNKKQFYEERLTNYLIQYQGLYPELNANVELQQLYPDFGVQYRSPIVFARNGRGAHLNQALQCGLPVYDSRYPQFPQYGGSRGRGGNNVSNF